MEKSETIGESLCMGKGNSTYFFQFGFFIVRLCIIIFLIVVLISFCQWIMLYIFSLILKERSGHKSGGQTNNFLPTFSFRLFLFVFCSFPKPKMWNICVLVQKGFQNWKGGPKGSKKKFVWTGHNFLLVLKMFELSTWKILSLSFSPRRHHIR